MSSELIPIKWEEESPGSFTPEFRGYSAGHYCTGNPELGWCLYSRGAGGCWNQRTKQQVAPKPGYTPTMIQGKWFWVGEPEIQVTNTPKAAHSEGTA